MLKILKFILVILIIAYGVSNVVSSIVANHTADKSKDNLILQIIFSIQAVIDFAFAIFLLNI